MRAARIIPGFLEGISAEFCCNACRECWTGRVDPEDGAPIAGDICPGCGALGEPTSEPIDDPWEE